jgi:hypothetical protein
LGYALGITGSVMMLLLLLYPVRKRAKFLRNAGPVRHWFRAHMMLGIIGPVLVLFHSNFNLGSINGQVALFCTLIVSSSGILGRYFYAKIHYGLYGQRATLDSVSKDLVAINDDSSSLQSIVPIINQQLAPLEKQVAIAGASIPTAFGMALSYTAKLIPLRYRLRKEIKSTVVQLAANSPAIAANQKRFLASTYKYLNYRVSVLRKFAQLRAFERLFSLWHIVHYPLFMVMVVAAIVHVVAVHMY